MKSYIVVNSTYAYATEICVSGIKVIYNTRYVILSEDVSWDYIIPAYIFRYECQIILSDNVIVSELLSANYLGHDGTLQGKLTEIPDDITLLTLL